MLFVRLLSHGTMLISALTCQIISNVPAAILLCRTEANTTALRDALAWIDDAGIACFETLIPKRQDILNAKSTRPRGSRLHEYRDLAAELKQTMRQLKDEEEDL